MTTSAISVGHHPGILTTDESKVISLDQRMQSQMHGVKAASPVIQDGANEVDNLALCHQLITKQIMIDMVTKDQDDDVWKEEWF